MKLNREKKEKERNDREMDAETRTFVSLLENDKLKLKDKKENVRKHIERIQNNVISKAFATYVLVTFITRLTYQRLTTLIYNTKHSVVTQTLRTSSSRVHGLHGVFQTFEIRGGLHRRERQTVLRKHTHKYIDHRTSDVMFQT